MASTKDEVFLVSGGGRGLGRAIVECALEQGYRVATIDLDTTHILPLQKVYGPGRLLVRRGDVADGVEVGDLVGATLEQFGRLDGLVNNAALVRDQLLPKMTEADWDRVLNVNLKGAFLLSQAVFEPMKAQGGGSIVNMISASALTGNPGQLNYTAAKGGLMAMTLTLSQELQRRNIAVNAVMPAAWTEMSETIPQDVIIKLAGEETLRRLQSRKPSQVAPVVVFLLSPKGRNITGQCVSIAGQELALWSLSKPIHQAHAREDQWTQEELEIYFREKVADDLQQPASVWL